MWSISKASRLLAVRRNGSIKVTAAMVNYRPFSSSITIPPNLQIPSEDIFSEPPKPVIPKIEYHFPILNVPTSIKVWKLNEPGVCCSEEAPMERKIFEVAIRKDIVHDLVRYIRNKRRQPQRTKRIGQIRGSKKKPRPQKGTGRAQVGNRRNSVWRGGQKAHGPVLRDFTTDLNRKVRAQGMMILMAAKYREGNLVIVDELSCRTPRTKDLIELLKGIDGFDACTQSALFVDLDFDTNFELASRNLEKSRLMHRRHFNVYDALKKEKLFMDVESFERMQRDLIGQYTHGGKRKSLLHSMNKLHEAQQLSDDLNLVTPPSVAELMEKQLTLEDAITK